MLFFYRLIINLGYWLVYPYGRAKAGSSELWRGRLGLIDEAGPRDIWLHAASVGEAQVLKHLVHYLNRQDPSLTFHITTVTATGLAAAQSLCQDTDATISCACFPLDAGPALRKTLDRIKPSLLVFAETEIWPNMIRHAANRKIPVLLVNARMSEKAKRRYRWVRGSLRRLFQAYDRLFFKTTTDLDRYRQFGVPEDHCVIAGDMKFDAPLPQRSEGRRQEIRYRLGVGREDFLTVAGSTRPGEEALLVDMYRQLKQDHPSFRLVLAPRHVERVPEITSLLQQNGLAWSIYGDQAAEPGIVVVNRMGILQDLFQAADLAFVGGTLVDIGGHNLLEPVWAGTPVLFGPSVDNVAESAAYIRKNRYGLRVESITELKAAVVKLLNGALTFRTKTDHDLENSATALVGQYILQRIDRVGTTLEKGSST